MLIYNVTTKIHWAIAEDWLKWMQETHIPDVMSSGCFEKHQLVRLLEVEEEEGPTYAAQYYTKSKALYDDYIANHANNLRQHVHDKWGNKFIAFRTLMELVD
jgi:hypothetical protein